MPLQVRHRLLRYFLVLFFPLSLFSQDDFPVRIRALEKSFGGRMGIMAKNLRTGEELAVAAKEKFPTASVIKLPVMVEYFYQVAEGRLTPTQRVKLDSSNNWAGAGLYQYFTGRTEQQLADADDDD
jgi:beta-lactamase class A